MKKITCYDCDQHFFSDTSIDMLNQLYAHYMEAHKKSITGASEKKKKEWMERFELDWKVTKPE